MNLKLLLILNNISVEWNTTVCVSKSYSSLTFVIGICILLALWSCFAYEIGLGLPFKRLISISSVVIILLFYIDMLDHDWVYSTPNEEEALHHFLVLFLCLKVAISNDFSVLLHFILHRCLLASLFKHKLHTSHWNWRHNWHSSKCIASRLPSVFRTSLWAPFISTFPVRPIRFIIWKTEPAVMAPFSPFTY